MTTTWEGFELAPAHGRWRFWVEQGRDELPAIRASSELVPFRRGRLHQPGIADTRRLELRGYIKETSLALLLSTRDEIKRLLNPEMAAPGLLVDAFEDGGMRWISAVPRSAEARYGGKATRLYSIELEALDPFWYGANGNIALDTGLLMDSGLLLDQGPTTVIRPTTPGHDEYVTVLGNADVTKVRVEVDGPSTAPVYVANYSLGVAFLHPQLTAGQTLIVDSGLRTVAIGPSNARGNLTLDADNRHGEYLRLQPGSNHLRIEGQPTEVRIKFPATYL